MQVYIKNVDVEWVPGAGGKKYGKAVVEYNSNGRDSKAYLVSFKNPDVFKKVQELIGQNAEVDAVKEGNFWVWKSIAASGGSAPTTGSAPSATAGTTRVSGSNYETREERAARQVMIAKQSSLDRAVEILKHNNPKDKVNYEEVIGLAQSLTDWVLGNTAEAPDASGFDTMKDDLPF